MIRNNFRSLDTSDLTLEERTRRMFELIERVRQRMMQEKANPMPAKEPPETLCIRTSSPQGRIPFGFQQNPYGRAVFEQELKWIERIHELALQKLSTEKIARLLNKEDRTSKRAGKWSRTAVWRTLKRFKKKTVTKSFCNDPSQTPQTRGSVPPPTIASKRDPLQDSPPLRLGGRAKDLVARNHFSTENHLRQKPCFPKPLQINDFKAKLPLRSSGQNDPYDNKPFCLRIRVNFGRIFGHHGRKKIVTPEMWEAHQRRMEEKTRTPQPPAIQKLLLRAEQLKKRLTSTGLTQSALARELGLNPSRITQILNLLKLEPAIRRHIMGLPPTRHRPSIGDRQWMRLARTRNNALQICEFKKLVT